MKNKAFNIIGIVTLLVIVLALICSSVYKTFTDDNVIISVQEYNQFLKDEEELATFRLEEERLIEARNDTEVVGATYNRDDYIYSLPQTEYEMIQSNITIKYFHSYDNITMHRSSAMQTSERAIYEVFYTDLAEIYTKRIDSIEEELNKLCLEIKMEWLANGYTKDVSVLALDRSNTELVYCSSRNGEIDFTIYDPPEQYTEEDIENYQ